jgi:hypothetical protein
VRPPCRYFFAAAAVVCITLIPACSSVTAPGPSAVPDPSSSAQATARLLAPGKTPGFLVLRADAPGNPAKAAPFVAPHGSLDHVCMLQMSPQLFMPSPAVGTGESLSLPVREQRRYLPLPPSWFELIDVYPGTEAAGIVKALPALIGKCGHFAFGTGGVNTPARESVTPLAGYGDQALYVSVRLFSKAPGKFWADDWIVIRSDRTLIFIDGQYVRPAGNARDRMTLQLAREAWQRYSDT